MPEVIAGDGGAADLKPAKDRAIPGQVVACIIGDFHLNREGWAALLGLQGECRFGIKPADFGLALIGGANGRHFRHAPGMDHAHAVFFLIGFGDRGRAG